MQFTSDIIPDGYGGAFVAWMEQVSPNLAMAVFGNEHLEGLPRGGMADLNLSLFGLPAQGSR